MVVHEGSLNGNLRPLFGNQGSLASAFATRHLLLGFCSPGKPRA